VLVKYGGGSGTKDDPYLISYYDQLELLAVEGGQGYFKQVADIYYPSGIVHSPINTRNYMLPKEDVDSSGTIPQNILNSHNTTYFEYNTTGKSLKNPEDFYFEYDGGGFIIRGLTTPLFGTVSGMVLKNSHITYSSINNIIYGNYGFFICEAYNYRYEIDGKIYETGETKVQNCTVSHSSIVLQLPTVDENGEEIIYTQTVPAGDPVTGVIKPVTKSADYAMGAITGLGGDIENCYVTDFGISANLENYILYAGGISGKPANVRNCGAFYVAMSGKIFNAGGVAGSGGGSRIYNAQGEELPLFYGGNIQGCFVRNFSAYSELTAGGIVAVGTTNAENAVISNCYANEVFFDVGEYADSDRTELLNSGFAGAIIGADGNDTYGHYVTNSVGLLGYWITGYISKTEYSDTAMLAPANSFYLESIRNVINASSIDPENKNPQELFTGSFIFEQGKNANADGTYYPFPEQISNLIMLVNNISQE
jgi:hypothetical protein